MAAPVEDADIPLDEAETACRAAVTAEPELPRLKFQLARVLFLKENIPDALVNMVQASHKAYPAASYAMAMLYLNGGPVESNPEKAIGLITSAAENGLPVAQRDLGMMYYSGSGLEKDQLAAFDWFMKAAVVEEPLSGYMAATMMCKGEVPGRDCSEGYDMLRHAAENDVVQAHFVLGQIYGGLTPAIPKDAEKYLFHMTKASKEGFFAADIALGRSYMMGELLAKDTALAAEHFCRAGTHGRAFAKDNFALDLRCPDSK